MQAGTMWKIIRSSFTYIKIGLLLIVVVSTLLVFLFENQVQSANSSCSDVQLIFARGSGERIDGDNYEKFTKQITNRIKAPLTWTQYELGEGWDGYRNPDNLYPAISVDGWNAVTHGLGAQVTAGDGFRYGLSVTKGVGELQLFLLNKTLQCPDTKFVLGGYSQGAQVVGEALAGISARVKNNIVFVALFGDPKLYLPEGEGFYPPACKGEKFSDWRRGVPNCHTDDGTLGARTAYIPEEFRGRVGLWCNDNDWICGSSKNALNNSGHSKYANSRGAISKSSLEIAHRLKNALPFPKNQYINDQFLELSDGEAKLNITYVWSTNASTEQNFLQTQKSVRERANQIWLQGGRVGLTVATSDVHGGSSFWHPMFPSGGPVGETLGLFAVGDRNHVDYRIADSEFSPIYARKPHVLSAAIETINTLPWQAGAEKAMIFIAEDADFKEEPSRQVINGRVVTIPEYLVLRALEIDPVNMYFIVGQSADVESAEYMADATGGKVFTYDPLDSKTLDKALTDAQQEILERPVVVFGQELYETEDGRPITIDVSGSYARSGEIVTYDWDHDGDGVWDVTTTVPHSTYEYPAGFSGLTHVRVTDSKGQLGTMTTVVKSNHVDSTSVQLPVVGEIQHEVLETKNSISVIRLTWKRLESAPHLALSVNGIHLGLIDASRTTIDITDIFRTQATKIELQVVDAEYNFGERSGVVVPEISKQEPISAPTDYVDVPAVVSKKQQNILRAEDKWNMNTSVIDKGLFKINEAKFNKSVNKNTLLSQEQKNEGEEVGEWTLIFSGMILTGACLIYFLFHRHRSRNTHT